MTLADRFRPTPLQYRRVTELTVAALAAIIVTGAAVRLTGSGLGCSDWPTCERDRFVAALDLHPMIEFVNRLITGLVSVAVIVSVLGSLRRRPRRADLTRWSVALVVGVMAQIVIGAFVTLSGLKYSVVAVHFLVSMALVWAAAVLAHRAGRADLDTDASPRRRWPWEGRAVVALGALVLASGSMVTSAGPHPGALPDSSGIDQPVRRLPIALDSAVRIHSLLVWCLCAAVVAAAVRIGRGTTVSTSPARRRSRELLVAVVAQGALGYVQYFGGVPAFLVAVHVAGATVVWLMALRLAFALAERPAQALAGTAPAGPSIRVGSTA